MNATLLSPKSRSYRWTRNLVALCLPVATAAVTAGCPLLTQQAAEPECECDAALTKLALNQPVAGETGLYALVVNYGGHKLCERDFSNIACPPPRRPPRRQREKGGAQRTPTASVSRTSLFSSARTATKRLHVSNGDPSLRHGAPRPRASSGRNRPTRCVSGAASPWGPIRATISPIRATIRC